VTIAESPSFRELVTVTLIFDVLHDLLRGGWKKKNVSVFREVVRYSFYRAGVIPDIIIRYIIIEIE